MTNWPKSNPLSVWCPQCGATRGVKCRTDTGNAVSIGNTHAERWRLTRPTQFFEAKVIG